MRGRDHAAGRSASRTAVEPIRRGTYVRALRAAPARDGVLDEPVRLSQLPSNVSRAPYRGLPDLLLARVRTRDMAPERYRATSGNTRTTPAQASDLRAVRASIPSRQARCPVLQRHMPAPRGPSEITNAGRN